MMLVDKKLGDLEDEKMDIQAFIINADIPTGALLAVIVIQHFG